MAADSTDLTRMANTHAEDAPEEPKTSLSPLGYLENVVMMLLLMSTVCVVAAGVVFRFLLRSPLSWSGEIATDLLIWIAFVGLAIGVRERAHVALVLFDRWLRGAAARWAEVVPNAAMTTMLVALLIGGVGLTLSGSGEISPSGVPLWLTYAAVPAGALLALLHLLWRLVAVVIGRARGGAGSRWRRVLLRGWGDGRL